MGIFGWIVVGLVAGRITTVAGASDVFRGAIVSYASAVKQELLHVPRGPVVSAEAAEAMARGVRETLRCDVGLALTGVAGPSEQDDMPVGTLFVGVAIADEAFTRQLRLPGQREQMRQMSVISALDILRRELLARG